MYHRPDMPNRTLPLHTKVLRYALITSFTCLTVLVYRRFVHVNQTTVALTFLVLVLFVATRWRLAYSVYLSILCTLCYNFFFLPPVGKMTIAEPQNWVTLAAFLCASVLVSHLSESEHRQAELSETRRLEVERLYEFSQQLLLQDDLRGLARSTPSVVAAVFGLRAVGLYVEDENAAYYSDSANELLSLEDLKHAAQASDASSVGVNGVRVVPLMLGMRSAGALAMTESDYSANMYEAIGGLVAIALERATALERSSRMEAARESERLRTALLDSVTHELRTPLTAIRAAATSLMSQASLSEEERQEMFAVVDEESARLDRLIGQAVEMAQLNSSSIKVNRKPEKLGALIDVVLEDSHSLLRDRRVEINIPEDLPALPMDGELIRRVLRHILENAAKYSPPGSPLEVAAELETYRLLVSVTDHGPGIDDSEVGHIFEEFFRGKNHGGRVQGTGMGLAIVKAILRAHQGGIEVRSRVGAGSTFTFWLPVNTEIAQATGSAVYERPLVQ
jgi:two-component system, OmpR family, sensor histidine kinase KdpD